MSGQELVFALLGVVAVGSAVLVVTTRQLVHAALWLVVSFGALAGGYLVLTAEFVAWVQVLIYVGAVIVLLLFGIMLTRAPIGRSADLDSGNRWVAAIVAVALGALLVTVLVQGFHDARISFDAADRLARDLPPGTGQVVGSGADTGSGSGAESGAGTAVDSDAGSAQQLGAGIFRTWVLPFEVLSVLLLAALIGAIVLSRGGGTRTRAERG